MNWIGVIALSIGLVAGLTAWGVRHYRPRIERDLLERTSSALKKRQVPVEQATFEGRDAKIIVEKSETFSAQEIQKAAESVFGVRAAKIEEVVKQDPSLTAERIGPKLRLAGTLPTKEIVALFYQRAGEVFGTQSIQSDLVESVAVYRAAYLSGLVNFLQLLERVGPESKLTLKDRWVTLGGLVPDEATKNALEKLARERIPAGLNFKSEILVPERNTSAARSADLAELLDAIRLNFEYDSTRLTRETAGNINLLKETLDEFQIERIRILGFTDSKGDPKYNLRLSRERALSIERKLAKLGYPHRRFETIGLGERSPVADNRSEEGRQLNRRVAFEILGEK